MLRYWGGFQAADMNFKAMNTAIGNRTVTYDLACQTAGEKEIKSAEFADELIKALFPASRKEAASLAASFPSARSREISKPLRP